MKKIMFFAIILFSAYSKAQTNIAITSFGPTPSNDTVLAGSSHTYDVWLKNYGPGTLNDIVHITTSVRDSAFTGLDSIDYFDAGNQTILPGDSSLITLNTDYIITPNGYRYGIDVIVIWPYALSATTVDSLEFSIYILDPNGTNELDVNRLIRLYPNPSTDQISIDNLNQLAVESIAIYDLSGKLILANKNQNIINTAFLKPGIYQTDVILSDKSHHVFKIMKQRNASE